ncbi:MAG: ribonuclease H-like domain-containing protein [Dehalogenimonas sp.]|uniref:Ribonuclease H-like domain-containing protein n=1 Tax=Candidatus Dehalogenimonas loeffleri TaxID=3127115 RepID=A0ABZ2J2E9_9CHLR|nr:ribonuclease H-like domain-containing protein [Dehalogenimonas sp.]
MSESFGDAYLDIETTGLSPESCPITVIGIHICRPEQAEEFIQLVGDDITSESLLNALAGVGTIYTYNGARFDLPYIKRRLGVDLLAEGFNHCDLMNHCHRHGLYGGLKKVEPLLGIKRILPEVNGYEAVRLWWRFINDLDQTALTTLLEYNKEDTQNLKIIRHRLIIGTIPDTDMV